MDDFKSFDFLCRCLSTQNQGACDPSLLRRDICNNRVNWQEAISLADKHYVLPLLHSTLSAKGLTDSLPTDLQKTLSSLHELNRKRNGKLKQQLTEIIQRLNTIDVAPVLLKGATALFSNLYPDSGCRMMGDLDLLVPADRLQECVQVLAMDGYSPIEDEEQHEEHHHWPPLARPDRIGCLELHHQIAAEPVARLLDAETIHNQAIMRHENGLQFQLCSDTHLAMHNILHHQLSGIDLYDRRTFSLYQVYDLVRLMQLPKGSIHWKKIFLHFNHYGYGRETSSYFIIIKHLFYQPLPHGVPELARSRLDWLLAKGQLTSPTLQYYFLMFVHLLKHREQRAIFYRQLISFSSYRDHYKRLAGHIQQRKKQ